MNTFRENVVGDNCKDRSDCCLVSRKCVPISNITNQEGTEVYSQQLMQAKQARKVNEVVPEQGTQDNLRNPLMQKVYSFPRGQT